MGGCEAQWSSTSLACMRPEIPSPALKKSRGVQLGRDHPFLSCPVVCASFITCKHRPCLLHLTCRDTVKLGHPILKTVALQLCRACCCYCSHLLNFALKFRIAFANLYFSGCQKGQRLNDFLLYCLRPLKASVC